MFFRKKRRSLCLAETAVTVYRTSDDPPKYQVDITRVWC